ncbi:hypothetical protein KAU11_04210, partial [Candidatus Babeliales bacterium]|nr:hypothetical protein [Candidatus Babeliales bacterium]
MIKNSQLFGAIIFCSAMMCSLPARSVANMPAFSDIGFQPKSNISPSDHLYLYSILSGLAEKDLKGKGAVFSKAVNMLTKLRNFKEKDGTFPFRPAIDEVSHSLLLQGVLERGKKKHDFLAKQMVVLGKRLEQMCIYLDNKNRQYLLFQVPKLPVSDDLKVRSKDLIELMPSRYGKDFLVNNIGKLDDQACLEKEIFMKAVGGLHEWIDARDKIFDRDEIKRVFTSLSKQVQGPLWWRAMKGVWKSKWGKIGIFVSVWALETYLEHAILSRQQETDSEGKPKYTNGEKGKPVTFNPGPSHRFFNAIPRWLKDGFDYIDNKLRLQREGAMNMPVKIKKPNGETIEVPLIDYLPIVVGKFENLPKELEERLIRASRKGLETTADRLDEIVSALCGFLKQIKIRRTGGLTFEVETEESLDRILARMRLILSQQRVRERSNNQIDALDLAVSNIATIANVRDKEKDKRGSVQTARGTKKKRRNSVAHVGDSRFPEDTRSKLQKFLPRWLGGKSAPVRDEDHRLKLDALRVQPPGPDVPD